MNMILVFFVLAALATETPEKVGAAGSFGPSLINQDTDKAMDFDKLDGWMRDKLKPEEPAEANLAFIKKNLQQLKDAGARRAAQVVVELAEVKNCDDHTLANLRELTKDKQTFLANKRRIDRILLFALWKLNKTCGDYIDQQVDSLYAASSHLNRFFEMVALEPNGWQAPIRPGAQSGPLPSETFFRYAGDLRDQTLDPNVATWARHLFELSNGDSQGQAAKHMDLPHHEAFDYSFNRYILEPCREATRIFGDTLGALHGLVELQTRNTNSYREMLAKRTNTVLPLLYTFKVCKSLRDRGSYLFGGYINEIYEYYSKNEARMQRVAAMNKRFQSRYNSRPSVF